MSLYIYASSLKEETHQQLYATTYSNTTKIVLLCFYEKLAITTYPNNDETFKQSPNYLQNAAIRTNSC